MVMGTVRKGRLGNSSCFPYFWYIGTNSRFSSKTKTFNTHLNNIRKPFVILFFSDVRFKLLVTFTFEEKNAMNVTYD